MLPNVSWILFCLLLTGCHKNAIIANSTSRFAESSEVACTCPKENLSDLTLYVCPSWLDETVREFSNYKADCSSEKPCSAAETKMLFMNIDRRLNQYFHKYMSNLPSEILYINSRTILSPNRKSRLRRFFHQPEFKHTRYLMFTLVKDDTRPLEVESAKRIALAQIAQVTNVGSKIIWDFPFAMGKKQYKEFEDDLLVHLRPDHLVESMPSISVLIVRTDCNIGQ